MKKSRIALWDVIGACQRSSSADSDLKECKPNDIPSLLRSYPNIESILFTGKKAETLFEKEFKKQVDLPRFLLPSPSPAYAAMKFEMKVERWREVLARLPGLQELLRI